MPISRLDPSVRADRFHHFHQIWTSLIATVPQRRPVAGRLLAMAEQIIGGPEPDVIRCRVREAGDKARGSASPSGSIDNERADCILTLSTAARIEPPG